MRKLRFLEISDLGDSLEEQERLYVFDAWQTWIQIQTSYELPTWSFFFSSKASLNFCFLFWKTQDNDNQFVAVVVVQSLSHVWLFATSWTVSHQASLSFTIFQSLLKLMSTEFVMPSWFPYAIPCFTLHFPKHHCSRGKKTGTLHLGELGGVTHSPLFNCSHVLILTVSSGLASKVLLSSIFHSLYYVQILNKVT